MFGAAARIRTGDLILTKVSSHVFIGKQRDISFVYGSRITLFFSKSLARVKAYHIVGNQNGNHNKLYLYRF